MLFGLTIKGDKCKLILEDNHLEIVKFNDYSISGSIFVLGDKIVPSADMEGIARINVNDIYKVENSYLCFNYGVCTEVTI